MKKVLQLILVSFVFWGCNGVDYTKDYTSHFSGKYVGEKSITLNKVEIDSIIFDDIESSYNGFLKIEEGQLVFVDKYYGYLFFFDNDGRFKSKAYGQGQGPLEVNTGRIFSYFKNRNEDVFLGASLDFHVHDSNRERQKIFKLLWGNMENRQKQYKSVTGEEIELYELNYQNLIVRTDKNGVVYLPLWAFTSMINPYIDGFYNKACLFTQVDLETEKIVGAFGRISPEYKKYKAVPQHMFAYYDIDKKNNNMYVSQEIDSLIYVYNDKEENIYSFGNAGKNMNTDYLLVPSFDAEKLQNAYFKDRPQRGYYSNIEYFEKFDLLFRCYTKGKDSTYDGLQIYKGTTLVADIDVPKGLNWVKGYIAPYFYSNEIVNDEEELMIKCFRFKLPDQLLKQ